MTPQQLKLIDFRDRFEGLYGRAPSNAQTALYVGMTPSAVQDELRALGITPPPASAPEPKPEPPAEPKAEPEPCEQDDDPITAEAYTPPSDLPTAQLHARRFRSAARMHLSEIERLTHKLNRLEQTRPPADYAQRLRAAELRIETLEAENNRLRQQSRTACAAWLSIARQYQRSGVDRIALGLAI